MLIPEKNSTVDDTTRFPRYINQEIELVPGGPKVAVRRITGDSSPYRFPLPRAVPLNNNRTRWPKDPPVPFVPRDFERHDDSPDANFYSEPRFMYYIDEPAVAALTRYYRRTIPIGSAILDICSSWTCHYPREFPQTMSRICAVGISDYELKWNDQVTGSNGCYRAVDLNAAGDKNCPRLPFPDGAFDTVTCALSIGYLVRPIDVLREVNRVLKPGGQVLIGQSDKCWPSKATRLWLEQKSDADRLELIVEYLRYAGGYLEPIEALDITPAVEDARMPKKKRKVSNDPMFVVRAVKSVRW
jgi:ubiquinone/menaquinone biosynthesis C-methylase UbiE